MTDWNVATGKEQPLNRTGFQNIQITGKEIQGTPVAVDTTGTENKLVAADAAPDASEDGSEPLHAVGVLLPGTVFPEDVEGYVDRGTAVESPYKEIEFTTYKEEGELAGDRATVIFGGIEMVNDDRDTSWTPGEPIYLAEGGGFTQTKPTSTGAAVQVLGVALDDEDRGPAEGFAQFGEDNTNGGRPRMLLDVDWDYSTV